MNPMREILERHLKISTTMMIVAFISFPVLFIWAYLCADPENMKWFIAGWVLVFIAFFIFRYLMLRCPSCGMSLQSLADFYKPSIFTFKPSVICCPYCKGSLEKNSSDLPPSEISEFRRKNILEKIVLLCMFFSIIIAAPAALYLNLQQKHGIDKANYKAIITLLEKGKYGETIKCLKKYEGSLQSGENPGEALKKPRHRSEK